MLFLCLLSILGEATAEDIPKKSASIEIEEGILQQKTFPLLESRRLVAQVKITAVDLYFAGESSFELAFPFLTGLSLHDPIVVSGLLSELQLRSDKREKERFVLSNSKIDSSLRENWRKQLFSVLDMESRADEKERRFLSSLRIRLESSPSLRNIDEKKVFWQNERALSAEPPQAEEKEEHFQRMNMMSQQEQRLSALWILIRDLGCANGNVKLNMFIEQELAFDVQEEVVVKGVKERLNLLLPFTDEETKNRIVAKRNQLKEFIFQQELVRQEKILTQLKNSDSSVDFSSFSAEEVSDKIRYLEEEMKGKEGVEKTLINTEIQILKHRLDKFSNAVNEAAKREEKVEEELNASRLKLEEAQRRREQEKEQKKQRVLDEIISLRKIAETFNSAESVRLKKIKEEKKQVQEKLQHIREKMKEGGSLPPLDSKRTVFLDDSYSTAHKLVRFISSKIIEHDATSREFEKDVEKLEEELAQYNGQQQSQERDQAISDIYAAIEFKRQHLQDELDELLNLLHEAKILRREVQPLASEKAKEITHQDFWVQVREEITLLPKFIEKKMLNLQQWYDDFPKNIFKMQAISGSLSFLFQSFIFVFFWRFGRKNGNYFFGWLLSVTKNFIWRRFSVQPRRLDSSTDEFIDISKRTVDILVLSWLSAIANNADFVVLSLLIYLLVFYFILQLVNRLVRFVAFFVGHVSWLENNELFFTKLTRAIRRFVAWWMFFAATNTFFIYVLESDKLADVFVFAQNFVLFVLLFHELRIWEKPLSSLAKGQTDSGFLYRWLQSLSTRSFRSRLRSIIALFILVQSFTGWCISLLIEGSGWIGKTLAKRSLQSQEILNVPLSKTEKEHIFSVFKDGIEYQEEEQNLHDFFSGWLQDDSIGLSALVGYHGSGKSHFLDRLSTILPSSGPHKKLTVTTRLVSERDALKWICESFAFDSACGAREVINQLRQEEPMLISIDDLHLGMIRDVGGYHALRLILSIMQATGNHHFWVASFHVYAWNFLNGEAIPVNLEVFRQKIEIKPLTSQELSHWFKSRVKQLQIGLSFNKLVSEGAHEKLVARAETAYWRLLADASGGNHSVAQHYLMSSVHKGEAENTVEMLMFNYHEEDSLEDLLDVEIFVLTSLLIHDGLSSDLIQRTLNLSRQSVYSACRHLIGLNIIEREGDLYHISRPWVPPVERFLNRRRLLFLET